MGDAKSPDLAQAAHQHALLGREYEELPSPSVDGQSALPLDCWLSYGYPTPTNLHWEGAYVDDFMCASIDSPSLDAMLCRNSRLEHSSLVARVRARYAELGIVRKVAKAKEMEYNTEIWGGFLSSDRQSLAGDRGRRQRVMDAVALALQMPAITHEHMEVLIGH
eukprot:98423-Amphidinium_carterae.1